MTLDDTRARSPLSTGSVIADEPAATDDDLDAAVALGLGHVRLPVSWRRAMPRPGRLDGGVIEHLLASAARARSAGIATWFHLLQPDVPPWFDDEGGFGDAATAGRWWPRWVEAVADALGGAADGWVPMEAPFAMAQRLRPDDPRRHGELVDTLCVAWRDAWRVLHGPVPVACSLDVRVVRIPRDDVVGAEAARRDEHLRWRTWLRALRDGTITIPGRADRELDDLAGACDQLGIAVGGDASFDPEPLLHRTADEGPDRPLALTFRPLGADLDARAEAVDAVERRLTGLVNSLPVVRHTVTDLAALAHARR